MSTEEKPSWLTFGNLKRVGLLKSLGYDPILSIEYDANNYGIPFSDYQRYLIQSLEERGLRVLIFPDDKCDTVGGAIYAYHPQALGDLLHKNRKTLRYYDWPQDTEKFVESVAIRFAEPPSPMFDLIADAFADYHHHERQKGMKRFWHRFHGFTIGTLI